MILYPHDYIKSILEIDIDYLRENRIKGLILDVDNTLIDYDKNFLKGIEEWTKKMKKNGVKMCILSNSNKKEKIENVANKLNLPYFYFAKKPLKCGFKKAKKELKLNENQIAVLGDQIMTDVLGARRNNMHAILVEPIKEKDIWITRLKRPLENWIIKRYIQQKKKSKEG